MSKKRVFISFDYDHDETLKTFLVGQSKLPDSPFELADWSINQRNNHRRLESKSADADQISRYCRRNLWREHRHRNRSERRAYNCARGKCFVFFT